MNATTAVAATTVGETILRHRLLEFEDRVLVALSGGADSTALLLLLLELGYDVAAGHVDHGMRPGSTGEAEHCREICERLGVAFRAERVSVAPTTEAEARRVRYPALERMALGFGASRIATGHTMDDQAETVLLRLERGGFPLGIPPRRGPIVRPLLDIRRRQTEAVCRESCIDFLTDPSNSDLRYKRNRIRHRLMPQLGDDGVLRLAAVAGRNRAMVERTAAAIEAGVAQGEIALGSGFSRIRRSWLARSSPSVRRAALRTLIDSDGEEVSRRLIGAVDDAVTRGRRLHLPGGRTLEVGEEWVSVAPPPREILLKRPRVRVAVPGRTARRDWGLVVEAELIAPPAGLSTPPNEALLDFSRVEELWLRSRRPGDRFRPLGAPGRRKLQDFLVDRKVPAGRRDSVPVIETGGRIAWVAGHRIAEEFRIRPSTERALRLRIFPFLP